MDQPHPIVVLDFGSQYTQLIARRIREMQVYSVVVPCSIAFEALVRMSPQALILSGGPASVYDSAAPTCDDRVFKLNIPTLGICYGLQLLSYKLGGKVEPATRREYGLAQLEFDAGSDPLNQPRAFNYWRPQANGSGTDLAAENLLDRAAN